MRGSTASSSSSGKWLISTFGMLGRTRREPGGRCPGTGRRTTTHDPGRDPGGAGSRRRTPSWRRRPIAPPGRRTRASGRKAVVVEQEQGRDQKRPPGMREDRVRVRRREHAVAARDVDQPLVERDAAKPARRPGMRPQLVIAGSPDDLPELRAQRCRKHRSSPRAPSLTSPARISQSSGRAGMSFSASQFLR